MTGVQTCALPIYGKRPEEKKPKIDEKAYQDALKRIPEPKEKYDPWSGARPATADKKASK